MAKVAIGSASLDYSQHCTQMPVSALGSSIGVFCADVFYRLHSQGMPSSLPPISFLSDMPPGHLSHPHIVAAVLNLIKSGQQIPLIKLLACRHLSGIQPSFWKLLFGLSYICATLDIVDDEVGMEIITNVHLQLGVLGVI